MKRPSSGLSTVSSAAVVRKTAPIATPPQPASCRRSGTSTATTPNRSAGSTSSHIPPSSRRSARRKSSLNGCGWAGTPGVAATQIASATPSRATPPKVARTPATVAIAPITGPNSAPKTAAPMTVPISAPRRSRGAAATSHASAPDQESALPTPCRKRAAPSSQALSAKAKTTLAAAARLTPASAALRGP